MEIEKNLNLLRSLAWKFHRATGLEYQELFSEAALAYCLATKKYDPSKGCKETTFLYFCIKNALINFCKKERRLESRSIPIDEIPLDEMGFGIEMRDDFMDTVHEWPSDCQVVAKMVINEAEFFIGETPNFKRTRGENTTAKQRLVSTLQQNGWKVVRIKKTMKEIKKRLTNS